jgi:acetyl-CoA acetyltransferase
MREVGVISYATSAVAKDLFHNEIEIIVPVFGEAVRRSGMQKSDIDFVCSGSLDYLFGGPFAFVAGVDAVGAVPPIRESHVEMDGAWALYEAWCYIQTGEIDSAVIYGFSKGSSGDPLELMTVQTDPYYTVPLWPSMSDLAALQARAFMHRTGATERDLAEVAARAQRNGTSIDYAVRASADATAEQLLAESPLVSDPLRESDIYPVSDGATVVVIAAEDVARRHCARPAWIRGFDHRIDPMHLGARDLSRAPSATLAAKHAGLHDKPVDVAELHAQFSHEELVLTEALGIDPSTTVVNPSGGPLAANVLMGSGLNRIGEVANAIANGSANRGVAHVSSGPCLQQNIVCVLEGE